VICNGEGPVDIFRIFIVICSEESDNDDDDLINVILQHDG
jgi:hypothetical protein